MGESGWTQKMATKNRPHVRVANGQDLMASFPCRNENKKVLPPH